MKNIYPQKKTVAIVDCQLMNFQITSDNLGGSQTWILEIAKEFEKHNWHVVIFANINELVIINNIEYIPLKWFKNRFSFQVFDLTIFSRGIICFDLIKSKRKYLILHDMGVARLIQPYDINKIDRIYILSQYAKDYVKNNVFTNISDDKFYLTHNGIDYNLYKNINQKENSMVWSSCKERGFDFFVEFVLPQIIKSIPDFILHVCSYNNYTYDNINDSIKNNLKFHGKLSKRDLANLQCKSKIWCYPNLGYTNKDGSNIFGETFCITAVENLIANNIIIAGNYGGIQTTLKGYPLVGTQFYQNGKILPHKHEMYGKYLAKYCINALTNNYKPIYNYKNTKFTWNNAYNTFINQEI